MLKYGSKKDKSLTAKGQAAKEGMLVWETEHLMDVKLFLEGQARSEADSSHCLIILHEMFQHTSEQGQKEVEHMIHQGCWHGLPKLDPKVDVPAVQLVGLQTCREEFESLYYEVYKLLRLLGSPPREPELVAQVMSSLEDHWGGREVKCHRQQGSPIPLMSGPQGEGPHEGEEGCLCRKESHWGKRGPPEGSGYGSCLGRRHRVSELPPHQEPIRSMSPFLKQGPPQT